MSLTLPFALEMADTALRDALLALADPSRHNLLHDLDRLRLRVAENITALSLRRHLSEQDIPHNLRPSASLSEADHLDLSIGGRRCIPAVQIVLPGQDPPTVVCVPEVEGGARYKDTDLYLFITLFAQVDRSREEIDRSLLAGKSVCLVHAMPHLWSRPEVWSGLGEVALKADTSQSLQLTLYGQRRDRETLTRSVVLSPRQRRVVPDELFSIGGVQAGTMPTGPVVISSAARKDVHLISPHHWGNIQVYGEALVSAGYMAVGELRKMARSIEGEELRNFHPCYGQRNLQTVSAACLQPLEELFARARQWQRG